MTYGSKIEYVDRLLFELYKNKDDILYELLDKECDKEYSTYILQEWSEKGCKGKEELDKSVEYLKSHNDKFVCTFIYLFCQYELHIIGDEIKVVEHDHIIVGMNKEQNTI